MNSAERRREPGIEPSDPAGPVLYSLQAETARIEQAAERHERRASDGRYSHLNRANLLALQQLERVALGSFVQRGWKSFEIAKILEVGCGSARWLREFVKWGATPAGLFGIDLIESRIALGKEICPPEVHLSQGSAAELEFENETFDIVVQSTVFTSIVDKRIKHAVASEMLRVLKPRGLILWYDFIWNNPRNPDVRGIGKEEIRSLFPGCNIELKRVTLAPPIGRVLAPFSVSIHNLVASVRFLRSHYFGVISKT